MEPFCRPRADSSRPQPPWHLTPDLFAITVYSTALFAWADTLDKTDCNGVVLDDSPFAEPIVRDQRDQSYGALSNPEFARSVVARATGISCRARRPSCAPPPSSAPRCWPPRGQSHRPSTSTTTPRSISRIAQRHPVARLPLAGRARAHRVAFAPHGRLQRLLARRPREHDARERTRARRLARRAPVLAHVRRLSAVRRERRGGADHRPANPRPRLEHRKRRSDSLRWRIDRDWRQRRRPAPLGDRDRQRRVVVVAGRRCPDRGHPRGARSSQCHSIQSPPRAQQHLWPS